MRVLTMSIQIAGIAGLCVGVAWLLGTSVAQAQAPDADVGNIEDITFQAKSEGTTEAGGRVQVRPNT